MGYFILVTLNTLNSFKEKNLELFRLRPVTKKKVIASGYKKCGITSCCITSCAIIDKPVTCCRGLVL